MVKAVTGPEGQERASRESEERQTHRAEMVAFVMGHTSGREFIWSLLADCGVYRSSFHASELIYFNEGRRDVGLKIMTELTSEHGVAYLLMQKEAMDRASQIKARESIYQREDNQDA